MPSTARLEVSADHNLCYEDAPTLENPSVATLQLQCTHEALLTL